MASATPEAQLRAASARIDRSDAQQLLQHVLECEPVWLIAHGDEQIDSAAVAAFDDLVARRTRGEPVAYLTGRRGFWSLQLAVDPSVLIPRPETELLVELALQRIAREMPASIADVGTGSGAVALAIAHERPQSRVLAVDASETALAIAARNAAALQINNIVFRHGDWLAPLAGERYTVIVSNPPYIATGDPHLLQGDLRFEPALALIAGHDGLDAIRRIVAEAPQYLTAGGWLLLEHGWQQAAAVRALLSDAGLVNCTTERDLEQRDRVTAARMPS